MQEVIQKKSEFSKMSKNEKVVFLKNDLIERMIRVEQRISAHFLRFIPYNKTKYYTSLTENQKKKFERYLRRKKIIRMIFIPVAILLLIAFVFLGFNITGEAVREDLGNAVFEGIWIYLFIFAIALIVGMNRIWVGYRRRRLHGHFKVLNDWTKGKLRKDRVG